MTRFRSDAAAVCILTFLVCGRSTAQQMIFPGDVWETAVPESVLVDSVALEAAVDQLGDKGDKTQIVRNGRVIWAGENVNQPWSTASVAKSFTSTVLGLLIDDGAVTLETPVSEFVPKLVDEYPDATFRHFATHTSGYRGTVSTPESPWFSPPGTQFKYGESYEMMATALTRAAGEPLQDFFTRRIADPIQMNSTGFRWSGGDISAENAARFGHLFLNRGNWDGTQLISSEWVDAATQLQLERIPIHPESDAPLGPGRYGFGWWIDGAWYEAVGGNTATFP